MKKIDAILTGVIETYASKVSKLENALQPFALWAVGYEKPYYMGFAVKELDLAQCENCNGIHFLINKECVATYFPDEHKAATFEGEPFSLQGEDAASIEALLKRLKAMDSPKEEETPQIPQGLSNMLKAMFGEDFVEVHRVRIPRNRG